MLKSVPKSNVSVRDFKVHKNWTLDNTDLDIVSASVESGLFDANSSNKQGTIYTTPLYKSLKAKYYNHNGNIVLTFGDYQNISKLPAERPISSTFYIIDIPQQKYGEAVKKQSVRIIDNTNAITYRDDGEGKIASSVPQYNLSSMDFYTAEIIITDNDGDVFTGTITSIDLETGLSTLTFGTDTDIVTIVRIDFELGTIQFAAPLNFDGLDIDEQTYGNIFYSDGLIVMRNDIGNDYLVKYKSTQTIYETEVLVTAKAGEFNYSQNPSAIEMTLSSSIDFEETAFGRFRARTKKIKYVEDIKRKESFVGSVSSSISGSWSDYYDNQLSDPTGSYITTYVTTIGLYDDENNMVAIAKLPKPIKNLPDYDLNFIIRLDT